MFLNYIFNIGICLEFINIIFHIIIFNKYYCSLIQILYFTIFNGKNFSRFRYVLLNFICNIYYLANTNIIILRVIIIFSQYRLFI